VGFEPRISVLEWAAAVIGITLTKYPDNNNGNIRECRVKRDECRIIDRTR
jgi:hypothetical protein